MRESTRARRDTGYTLKLLGVQPRRSKEEIAAEKTAAQHKKDEAAAKEKEKTLKRAAALRQVSQLEDTVANADAAANTEFPRNVQGVL
jgi:hypothetical protein